MAQTSPQRYRITERIDAGGMAEVFKGVVTSIKGFEKQIAIKRILPSLTQDKRFVRMFLDEAKLSLFLNHTNIVQVFDIGQSDATYFIVMEFVDGANLKNILNLMATQGTKMPIEQAVFVAMEVCKGLDHAHGKKGPDGIPLEVVHRDISPPNVLISRDGEVKITDFGLAKAVIQLEHTDPGIVKGKFGYLSPEAALGETVDLRTDIFAVGILLWEMIAGRRLFLGETDLKTLEQVRAAQVPRPRADIPPELEEIIKKTLCKERSGRFQSAREMGSSLARFLFSYGKPVTSYDLASLVNTALNQMPAAPSPKDIGVIDILIQNEMEKFISVEEMEDLSELNVVGAKPLTIDDLEVRSSNLPSYGFEDPRTWAGDALDSEDGDPAKAEPVSDAKVTPPAPSHDAPVSPDESSSKMAWMVIIVLLTLVVIGLILLIAVFVLNKG